MQRLPQLTVTRSNFLLAAPSAGPGIEVWRDLDGTVCAYGYSRGDTHCLHFPGVAEYRFSSASARIRALAPRETTSALIRDTYQRSVLPMALQASSLEVLHASAVQMAGGLVALCGSSGTGKSTIAFGLSRSGHKLWADDAVAFDVSGPTCLAVPLPFRIRLRRASAKYFHATSRTCQPHPRKPVPLAAICVLAQEPGGITLRRIPAAEAFRAILTHAHCFTLQDPERTRRMMQKYMQLCAALPVFAIRFPDDIQQLPAVLESIERAMETL
jgi:hypothetical protein